MTIELSRRTLTQTSGDFYQIVSPSFLGTTIILSRRTLSVSSYDFTTIEIPTFNTTGITYTRRNLVQSPSIFSKLNGYSIREDGYEIGRVALPIVAGDTGQIITRTGIFSIDFEATPVIGERPLTVKFTNLSNTPQYNFLWYFGDGNTSTRINPIHTYDKVGMYSVTLLYVFYDYYGGTHYQREYKENYITVYDPGFTIHHTNKCFILGFKGLEKYVIRPE